MVGWLTDRDGQGRPISRTIWTGTTLQWQRYLLRRPILKQNVETDTACTIAPSGLFEVSFLMTGERSPETLGWVEDAV
jgi:hypothetical protein